MILHFRLFAPAGSPPADPIDHPAFEDMSLRDLADLPLPWPSPAGDHDGARAPDPSPTIPAAHRPDPSGPRREGLQDF